jgi:hypothetical protein
MKKVAVDLDGLILHTPPKATGRFPVPLMPPNPGAQSLLQSLRDVGLFVIVHTARISGAGTTHTVAEITDHLKKYLLPFDLVWDQRGKPIAHAYLDDRAVLVPPDLVGADLALILQQTLALTEKGY